MFTCGVENISATLAARKVPNAQDPPGVTPTTEEELMSSEASAKVRVLTGRCECGAVGYRVADASYTR